MNEKRYDHIKIMIVIVMMREDKSERKSCVHKGLNKKHLRFIFESEIAIKKCELIEREEVTEEEKEEN
jgi:hypothetical protein